MSEPEDVLYRLQQADGDLLAAVDLLGDLLYGENPAPSGGRAVHLPGLEYEGQKDLRGFIEEARDAVCRSRRRLRMAKLLASSTSAPWPRDPRCPAPPT